MLSGCHSLGALLCSALLCIASGARYSAFEQHISSRESRGSTVTHSDAAEKDRVSSLPGWGPVEGMYSGYITVNETARRALFYAYVESQQPDAPLLLWLNGGPGCSSLGGGFMSELGPFFPMPGGKLQANPYSWDRVANVLFIESPAMVGFSYSLTESDAIVGDARTAVDLRSFLLGFMERFPALASRPLFLSGESYAGHYVPGLAWEIVKGNRAAGKGDASGKLNLAGLLVGNPWTDAAIDNLGAVDMWHSHALISDQAAMGIRESCNFTHIGPLDKQPDNINMKTREGACAHYCNLASAELGNINIYEIYAPMCPAPSLTGPARALARALAPPTDTAGEGWGSLGAMAALKQHSQAAATRKALTAANDTRATAEPTYDPCVDDEVFTYLNRPEVQRALHANETGTLPGPWTDCTDQISYSRADLLSSMLPTWANLVAEEGLRFMVYSGDVDGIVPVVGTRRWVAGLGLQQAEPWRPWLSGEVGQVGGYTVEYSLASSSASKSSSSTGDEEEGTTLKAGASGRRALKGGLVFATVRGAGHMVPYTKPERALHLLTHFLDGDAL